MYRDDTPLTLVGISDQIPGEGAHRGRVGLARGFEPDRGGLSQKACALEGEGVIGLTIIPEGSILMKWCPALAECYDARMVECGPSLVAYRGRTQVSNFGSLRFRIPLHPKLRG